MFHVKIVKTIVYMLKVRKKIYSSLKILQNWKNGPQSKKQDQRSNTWLTWYFLIFGPFWSGLVWFGLVWSGLSTVYCREFVGHFGMFWDIWDVLRHFWTSLGIFGHFGTLWDIFGRFWDVLWRFGIFWDILVHFWMFFDVLGHFGTF